MEFNAIKVRTVQTDHDVVIPLAFLQLLTIVNDGKAILHLVRDSSRGGLDGYTPMDIAATSNVISKEDYEMLTDVLFKFKQNPLKFEGRHVLTREDWPAIIAHQYDDVFTTEAEREIKEKGLDADIGFRDIHGNTHSGLLKNIIPWTERRSLMPKDWNPEYWIRTLATPEPHLSRNDSIRVPYTEYKRVTGIVLKHRNYPGDRRRAAAAEE